MLAKVLKEHAAKQAAAKTEAEKRRKAVLEPVAGVSDALLDSVNADVSTVFVNQRKIESESRVLLAQAQRLEKQAGDWFALLASFQDALKELGDVDVYTRTIEHDIDVVGATVEHVLLQQQSALDDRSAGFSHSVEQERRRSGNLHRRASLDRLPSSPSL